MGIGRGSGRTRAPEAAAAAISSPLLDFPIEKARGVVFNIVGGNDLTLQEINAAAEVIFEAVDPNANIIFGALVDESMEGEIAITVIATGFPLGRNGESMDDERYEAPSTVRQVQQTVGEAMRTAAAAVQLSSKDSRAKDKERERDQRGAVERERERPTTTRSSPGSRIVSTDDDDLPDFLSKLRRKR